MRVTNINIKDNLNHEVKMAARDLRQAEKQRWRDTLEALEDIRMNRIIDRDEVHAWLNSWGTDTELDAPMK